MQILESGEQRSGLTLSIIRPLGKLGIEGNEFKTFLFTETFSANSGCEFSTRGGDTLSCLFLTAWRVLGGDGGDNRKALRFRF